VKLLANVLKEKCHVQQGDVVLIYMPMIPQAIVAMLACARLGLRAIHNLIFGGFSANELAVRMKHSQPKPLISGKRTTGGKTSSFAVHSNSRL
jgi:propionyl-CoA synthetase